MSSTVRINALRKCPQTIFIGHGPAFWAQLSADDEYEGYPKGPVKKGGAVPRLLAEYENLYAAVSAGSGYNALTRDERFGPEFLEGFQDKLLFGTDVVKRDQDAPIVHYIKKIRQEKKIGVQAYEKIVEHNATRLLGL